MSKQCQWKHYYRQIRTGMIYPEYIQDQRNDMRAIRREAALERALAAANRRIEALELALYDKQEQADHWVDLLAVTERIE